MDAAAFGLSRNPFQRSTELDDACLPNTIAAILSELQSTLRSPRGVSVLTAAPGSGKSVAAGALARRLATVARVALLDDPTSSVSAVARDALTMLEDGEGAFCLDDDWASALRANVDRSSAGGRRTVIIIDDAHRLSPQALEDLAGLFDENAPPRLHIFLFGRPRLLDRMNAGAEHALHAHLLQTCRIESLGVRESVRYLERRIAICGGELSRLCSDDAIEQIVQKAEGRMIRLEEVASEALRRTGARGARRASAEDVVAIASHAIDEEEEVMAAHQQPLRFTLTDAAGDDADRWTDEDSSEQQVEWGDELDEDDEEWEAADEDDASQGRGLAWERSSHGYDEDERGRAPKAASLAKAASGRRLFGPAVLSITACIGLVWAANHLPGPASDSPRGRDSMVVAKPLSSQPQQIMRLATTLEEADADAQVAVWRAQPPRPSQAAVRQAEHVVREVEAKIAAARAEKERVEAVAVEAAARSAERAAPAAGAATKESARHEAPDEGAPRVDARATAPVDTEIMGPPVPALLTHAPAPAIAARAGSATEAAEVGPAPARIAAAKALPAVARSGSKTPTVEKAVAKPGAGAVYTVQLGAFKTRSNAEELVGKLRGKPTRILREGGLYRVMSGSFSSKQDASIHEATLRRAGYTTYVRTAVF